MVTARPQAYYRFKLSSHSCRVLESRISATAACEAVSDTIQTNILRASVSPDWFTWVDDGQIFSTCRLPFKYKIEKHKFYIGGGRGGYNIYGFNKHMHSSRESPRLISPREGPPLSTVVPTSIPPKRIFHNRQPARGSTIHSAQWY